LKIIGYKYFWYDGVNWIEQPKNDVDIELRLKGLSWQNKKKRTLLMNIKVPIVNKNVDLCLFDGDFTSFNKSTDSQHRDLSKYLALGELKGGIDPAGADEHWKTANSALIRIRAAFEKLKLSPKTFFVASAIEKSMAEEIYNQLINKNLSFASNLTNETQLVNLCNWIVKL